jgi:hypothetical protein
MCSGCVRLKLVTSFKTKLNVDKRDTKNFKDKIKLEINKLLVVRRPALVDPLRRGMTGVETHFCQK